MKIPRRALIPLMTPAEKAIWKAQQAVEKAGCHALLTAAAALLSSARDKVADFVDQNTAVSQQTKNTSKPSE